MGPAPAPNTCERKSCAFSIGARAASSGAGAYPAAADRRPPPARRRIRRSGLAGRKRAPSLEAPLETVSEPRMPPPRFLRPARAAVPMLAVALAGCGHDPATRFAPAPIVRSTAVSVRDTLDAPVEGASVFAKRLDV